MSRKIEWRFRNFQRTGDITNEKNPLEVHFYNQSTTNVFINGAMLRPGGVGLITDRKEPTALILRNMLGEFDVTKYRVTASLAAPPAPPLPVLFNLLVAQKFLVNE